MDDKVKDYKPDKEVFIIYLEDNNRQVSAYVYIQNINEGLITFKTNKNIITLPVNRIIKIKESL
jgi:hypothetical protein